MAKQDPAMALVKQRLAASSPGMDGLIEKDPREITDADLAAGIAHARNERAMWVLKEQRKGKAQEEE